MDKSPGVHRDRRDIAFSLHYFMHALEARDQNKPVDRLCINMHCRSRSERSLLPRFSWSDADATSLEMM